MAVLASLARLLGAIAIGLGLAAAGWFVGEGLRAPPPPEAGRITAQGTAERDVRADLAVWPLRFVVTGDYLTDVRAAVGEAEPVTAELEAGRPTYRKAGHSNDVVNDNPDEFVFIEAELT